VLFQKCLSDMIMEFETTIESPFNSGRDTEKKKSTFIQALEPIFISLGDSCSSVDGRSFIIVELIKYLLYTRQQVPSTFEELKKITASLGEHGCKSSQFRPKRLTIEQKNIIKLVERCEILFEHLKNSLANVWTNSTTFLILFGTTSTHPKEAYYIQFCNRETTDEKLSFRSEQSQTKQHLSSNTFRKLIQAFIRDSILIFNEELVSSKMFFLIKANRDCCIEPESFLPKPNFRLRGCRKTLIIRLLCNDCKCNPVDIEMEESEEHSCDQQNIWFQSTMYIKGLSTSITTSPI